MDIETAIQHMTHNADRVRALAQDIPGAQAHWKPDPASWSILQVINHLYDEEQYDFRVRLDIALHKPDQPWPPIDPGGWVIARAYNDRELTASLQNYLRERDASLQWLAGLQAPELDKVYKARLGEIRAGDILAAWVAHDLLHMRQLVELHWAWLQRLAEPYHTIYAGDW